MTRDEFWGYVAEWRERYPKQRYGQAVFNTAVNLVATTDRAEAMRATALDPFYDDTVASLFIDELGLS